jgi:hypothetical protein
MEPLELFEATVRPRNQRLGPATMVLRGFAGMGPGIRPQETEFASAANAREWPHRRGCARARSPWIGFTAT